MAPVPPRWHFLIEDPKTENGLREYVVANREIVAEREISQFATHLTPGDVVGRAAVKIDSDAVTRVVQRYAAANGISVETMNFRLRKDDLTSTPVWTVVCRDTEGKAVASLIVDSRDGRVLAHEGFAMAPPPATPIPRLAKRRPGDDRLPPIYEGPWDEQRRIPVRRAEPVRRERPPLPDPVREVRRLIHRILPF